MRPMSEVPKGRLRRSRGPPRADGSKRSTHTGPYSCDDDDEGDIDDDDDGDHNDKDDDDGDDGDDDDDEGYVDDGEDDDDENDDEGDDDEDEDDGRRRRCPALFPRGGFSPQIWFWRPWGPRTAPRRPKIEEQ